MTENQIDIRLTMLEEMMASADVKDLPALNKTYQRLIDELVRRDLAAKGANHGDADY